MIRFAANLEDRRAWRNRCVPPALPACGKGLARGQAAQIYGEPVLARGAELGLPDFASSMRKSKHPACAVAATSPEAGEVNGMR
jgi:hypothetical protein